jgi:hypothetical protein
MVKRKRKRKTKHLKLSSIGGHATVHLGTKRLTVTVTVPLKRLRDRLH